MLNEAAEEVGAGARVDRRARVTYGEAPVVRVGAVQDLVDQKQQRDRPLRDAHQVAQPYELGVVAHGPAAALLDSPAVRAAYLGDAR